MDSVLDKLQKIAGTSSSSQEQGGIESKLRKITGSTSQRSGEEDTSASFARNKAWSKPGPYITKLSPQQEVEFNQWAKKNPDMVQGELSDTSDYDVRGRWLAEKNGDPAAKLVRSKFDGKLHANDKWKTPYHRTFSAQSVYANPNAPQWKGDQLFDKDGTLIADETPGKKKATPEPDWDANDYKRNGLPVPANLGKQPAKPDPSAMARFQLYTSARAQGMPRDQALQRVSEYNYAAKQGISPERSAQFAGTLDFRGRPKRELNEQEKSGLKEKIKSESLAAQKSNTPTGQQNLMQRALFGSPEEYAEKRAQNYVDRYSYAVSRGKNEDEAKEYAESSTPAAWQKVKDWMGDTFQSTAEAIGMPHLKENLTNPFFETDQRRRYSQFTKYREADWDDKHLGKVVGALDVHLTNFIEGLTDAQNTALLIATEGLGIAGKGGAVFKAGEEAAEEAAPSVLGKLQKIIGQTAVAGARKAGEAVAKNAPGEAAEVARVTEKAERALAAIQDSKLPVSAIKIARTTQELVHAGFTLQLAQGAGQGISGAVDKLKEGDTAEASGYMLDGLLSGLMAAQGIHESVAKEKMRVDLDSKTSQMYPDKAKFGKLNDYEQAAVITQLVEDSPDYQHASVETKKQYQQRVKRLNYNYNRALASSWQPDAVTRAMRQVDNDRQAAHEENYRNAMEAARQHYLRQFTATLKDATERAQAAEDARRAEERGERPSRKVEAAAERTAEVAGKDIIAGARETAAAQRTQNETASREQPAPKRSVDVRVDESGHASYGATYYGEDSSFGVAGNDSEIGVYRQTPRGIEYLDADGFYSENPENLYTPPNHETAETVAKLSSLRHTAEDLAEKDGASPADKKDAADLAVIENRLITGELTADEARKQAGIAEKTNLPTEFDAARAGQLNGPLHERTPEEYQTALREAMTGAGYSEEEADAAVDDAATLVRSETESNLHHVSRSGDYIVSGKGTTWTLDSKGKLHPDDGSAPVPLMKNGRYSNQAMQLSQSGRVGYGGMSREQRRAETAKNRAIKEQVSTFKGELIDALNHVDRIAAQQRGLETTPENLPREDEGEKGRRRNAFEKPRPEVPVATQQVNAIAKQVANSAPEAWSKLEGVAAFEGVAPDEVLRQVVATQDTPEGKVAGLEVGDKITDPFKKDPWVVEQDRSGLALKSMGGARLPLDRLDPSLQILELAKRGEVVSKRPSDAGVKIVKFDPPSVVTREKRVETVKEIAAKPPEPPKTLPVAEAKAKAAEKRTTAAQAVAVEDVVEAQNPTVATTPQEVDKKVEKAEESIKTAETAYAQQAKAEARTTPDEAFPERAPVSVGLVGNKVTLRQNQQEFPAHYEAVPIESLQISHRWEGNRQVPNEGYPQDLQPRTISDDESRQNALRATPVIVNPGADVHYSFAEYADKTINGSMGPSIIDAGGRVVGGNTRLGIMLKHLELLRGISDPEMREAAEDSFRAQMSDLAREVGIPGIPQDGKNYAVVRMMDQPIESTQQAVELGKLFNKQIGVVINEDVMAVSYGKLLTPDIMREIAERVDSRDGLRPAMQADPDFFRHVVDSYFGVGAEEHQNWYEKDALGNVTLNDRGKDMFEKALLGTVIRDTAVLDRIKDTAPHRALGRALANMLKLQALPDRNIIGKINEAVAALAETRDVDPQLSLKRDKWYATYQKDQVELAGLETEQPEMPDRIVEAIWRALNEKSVRKSASPTYFTRILDRFIEGVSLKGGNLFSGSDEALRRPVDYFNSAFSAELEEIRKYRGDTTKGISETEFRQSLSNLEMSEQEREDSLREEEGKKPIEESLQNLESQKPTFDKPALESLVAKTDAAWKAAQQRMAEEKASKGYITPEELKRYLEFDPVTKGRADENYRVAKLMAEYVYDADPPVGVDRKDALGWVLQQRVAGIGRDKGSNAGAFRYPRGEEAFGRGFILLLDAAHEGTFIHEFAHAVFPMLSDDDIKAISSIRVDERDWRKSHPKSGWDYPEWDGKRDTLVGKTFEGVSEKFSYGLEKVLRDENPTGFSMEVKKVLEKVKQMFVTAYRKFAEDPLSPLNLTDEAKEVFTKMLGITEMDAPDNFRKETEKARAAEKKKGFAKPTEETHPIQKTAKDLGATGIRKAISGNVLKSFGGYINPLTSAVLRFPDLESSALAWIDADRHFADAELVDAKDGTYGIRFNTKDKIPNDVLYQDAPKKHPGIELEELEAKLKTTTQPMIKRLLELRIQNLKNEVRASRGIEPLTRTPAPEVAKAAIQEVKDAKLRGVSDVNTRPGLPARTGGFSKPAVVGLPRHADAGDAVKRSGGPIPGTATLTSVKPVGLQPQAERGKAVGILPGEKFDSKAWVEGNKKAGLPENAPPPTVALSRETAQTLKYGGQKQVVQLAMSALDQGDGFVISTPPGTGKTWTNMAIVKEFQNANPGAKILFITKNRSLMRDAAKVGKQGYGFDLNLKTKDEIAEGQVYGTSYRGLSNNPVYANTDWDLVIADEASEARNWFMEENQQGKKLMEVMDKAKKSVYSSATPFHSPMEYGYAEKLGLWPKGGFENWIKDNFAHEKIGDKIVARLDPAKQAKLRQQLIERGQFVSQQISYDGFTTHFGIVPVSAEMNRSLNRIHEGISRAKAKLIGDGKKGLADRLSAFEATYTKAYLERSRLPEAVQLARRARAAGWHVIVFSETTSEDLFRRPLEGDDEGGTYRKLDGEMGGELSRIIPPFPNVYEDLKAAFGEDIVDYSGYGGTDAERQAAKDSFDKGDKPMAYTTYAAGGIGGSWHDVDGDKPRLSLFLGPPYSGVLLEQSLGRTWRFGVKSNARAVFLATDSEPDIRLMATKVGPRMRAVNATVLGERDSIGTVMGNYTDEEKMRERQDMLTYEQGNEQKVSAQSFQVRSKRKVDIDNWSAITFPNAREAHNKGMQIEVSGKDGDWATMYQAKGKAYRPPTLGEAMGYRAVDAVADSITKGENLPPGLQSLEPADRETLAGGSSAVGAVAVDIPVDSYKPAVGRMASEAAFKAGWRLGNDGIWRVQAEGVPRTDVDPETEPMPQDVKTSFLLPGALSGETMIRSIAKQAGNLEAGIDLVIANRKYTEMTDGIYSDYANMLAQIQSDTKLNLHDKDVMRQVWGVVEGKRTSADPAINKAAEQVADMHELIKDELAKGKVKLKAPSGDLIPFSDIQYDRSYMPHRIDWSAKLEDPLTKEVRTLKEIMGKTFGDKKRERMIASLAQGSGMSPREVVDYLNQMKTTPPVMGHIHRARTVNFPIYRQDIGTELNYLNQVAHAIATEKVFGSDLGKLNKMIDKIGSANGRTTIKGLFDTHFKPQDWSTNYGKLYNAMAGYEALSKMTWSALKVPFHVFNVPLALGGDIRPLAQAAMESIFDRKNFNENTAMAGTIIHQLNPMLLVGEGAEHGVVRQIFKKTQFERFYKWGRAVSGASARVWMEQHAMNALVKGGQHAEEARRILKERMLIGDAAIDRAMRTRQWQPEDLMTAQRGFANFTMFSDNPLQMPKWARMDTGKDTGIAEATLARAVRMSYLLQSFAVKIHSLVKETVYDEIVEHGNYKPLAYLLLAEPLLGQMLKATGAAIPSGVHRAGEQLAGKEHKEDAWDKFLAQFTALHGDHPIAAALKIYVDGMASQTALDYMRLLADPLLDMAADNKKKARTELRYLKDDVAEQVIGPAWTDLIVRTLEVITSEGTALMAKEGDKADSATRGFMRWLLSEVPAFKVIPGAEEAGQKQKAAPINLY